jgi:YggT family protein
MLVVQIAILLIDTFSAILGVALLLRGYMNWVGMPTRNPLAQFAIALTDWMVRPLRRVLPAAGRWDTASLVGALLVALVAEMLTFAMQMPPAAWPVSGLLTRALLHTLQWALYTIWFLTIVHVILSWVNPYAPVAPAVAMLVRPFLAPFQRILPPIGGFDLSPVLLFVVVNILLMVIGSFR